MMPRSGLAKAGMERKVCCAMSRPQAARRKVSGRWTVAGWTGWLDVRLVCGFRGRRTFR